MRHPFTRYFLFSLLEAIDFLIIWQVGIACQQDFAQLFSHQTIYVTIGGQSETGTQTPDIICKDLGPELKQLSCSLQDIGWFPRSLVFRFPKQCNFLECCQRDERKQNSTYLIFVLQRDMHCFRTHSALCPTVHFLFLSKHFLCTC